MIDVNRVLYPVQAAQQPFSATTLESGLVVWTEVISTTPGALATDPPVIVYGTTYADQILYPEISQFQPALRLLQKIIDKEIPAQLTVIALEVVAVLVTEPPAYQVHFDGTTWTIIVPPPVDYVESHNWAGWPQWPFVSPYP